MNLDALERQAGAAEGLLKAVANRRRLTILCELSHGERSVTALGEAIGLSQSALSQHLGRLRADRIVTTRRESQTIYYSLESDRVLFHNRFHHETGYGWGGRTRSSPVGLFGGCSDKATAAWIMR